MRRAERPKFLLDIFNTLSLKGSVKILIALKEQGSTKYLDLVKKVGFATTTTRALKALEENKFVTREVLDEPYRPVAYSLTDKGKRLLEIVMEIEKL